MSGESMSAPAPSSNPPSISPEKTAELKLISGLFHRINRILPEQQILLTFPPEMSAGEAVSLLKRFGYSQAPVVVSGSVLGIFSYRSFSLRCATFSLSDTQKQKRAPHDFAVEECLEQFPYVRVSEEIESVFDVMDRNNGILVGTPELLQGILTPMDVLRYFYGVASPFVMISEIELTLRALIRNAMSAAELAECAFKALEQLYGADKVPKNLEEMTFDNYRSIISHGVNWPRFEPVLGINRARISAKLAEIGEIRNDIFHFKREITSRDHEIIRNRSWLKK
jgi:predicted transcriptional regulator